MIYIPSRLMEILTLNNGGEAPLRSFQIDQEKKYREFVAVVMASYRKNLVLGDVWQTLRLVREEMNKRGSFVTSTGLYHCIRFELAEQKRSIQQK